MSKERFDKIRKAALASGKLRSGEGKRKRNNYCVLGILLRANVGNWYWGHFPMLLPRGLAGDYLDGACDVIGANDCGNFELAFQLAEPLFVGGQSYEHYN